MIRRRVDWNLAVAVLAALIVTSASLELGLRLLEPFGWRLERWGGVCGALTETTPLHHRPGPGSVRQRLGGAMYGQFAGMEYEESYDERGIKRSTLRPQDGEGTRILFMGDSFIQGYDDANTVPQRAYEWLVANASFARPIIVLNAAYSSYSPLIFTVQAKQLLPVVRPDFVVVDIDETDLYDDAVRYRPLVLRDEQGRVIGIDRNPEQLALEQTAARARCSPVYLLRLAGTLYYQAWLAVYERQQRMSTGLLAIAETPEDEIGPDLRAQMQYFSTTLAELFATLKEYLPPDRILVVHHPHQRHLETGNDGRPVMNRQVGNLVRAAAASSGISFFDAQDELAARFAGHPERYYWSGDMHFNFDGIRAYGDLVGRELLRKLEAQR